MVTGSPHLIHTILLLTFIPQLTTTAEQHVQYQYMLVFSEYWYWYLKYKMVTSKHK
jgi:hypothetical protein